MQPSVEPSPDDVAPHQADDSEPRAYPQVRGEWNVNPEHRKYCNLRKQRHAVADGDVHQGLNK